MKKYLTIMFLLIFSILITLSAVSASQDSNDTKILEVSQDTILNSNEGEMIAENQNEILNGGTFADILFFFF